MEWVQKKARLSCLLRLQCLTATPHRGHLKPVPPIPPSCLPSQVTGSVFHSIPTTRHCVNTDLAFTDYALRAAFLFFISPWNYKGVSTPWVKTFENSYKTLKPFRVQYLLIPLHRLKLVLPWKVSAEVKCDWKMSHHALLEAFSKRVVNAQKLRLTVSEGVPLPPSLPFTPFSQETEKYFLLALHE